MNPLFEPLIYPKAPQQAYDPPWNGTVAPNLAGGGHSLPYSTAYKPFIRAYGTTAAARAARIRTQLDPPPQRLRAFEEDYPSAKWPAGPPVDATGRLTHDIDGEPINPDALVIGRRTLNGPDGTATLTQLRELIRAVIGVRPRFVSNREVLPKTVGGMYRKEPGWRLPPGIPADARPEWDDGYLKDILVQRRMPTADRRGRCPRRGPSGGAARRPRRRCGTRCERHVAGFPNPIGARSALDALASHSAGMYDLPRLPQRAFEEDYPHGKWPDGAPSDTGGRLTHDIEGRRLVAAHVVGRRNMGEADQAGAPDAALAKATTGEIPAVVPRSSDLLVGDDGRLHLAFSKNGRLKGRAGIALADDLDADSAAKVLGHEIAHCIDMLTNPPKMRADFRSMQWGQRLGDDDYVVEEELYRIYRDLNNPRAKHWGPTDAGYSPRESVKELWGSAFHAYMLDPNYMKTVAPRAAATIRAAVNDNPRLNPHIQFNSLVPLVALPSGVGLTIGGLGGLAGYNRDRPSSYDPPRT